MKPPKTLSKWIYGLMPLALTGAAHAGDSNDCSKLQWMCRAECVVVNTGSKTVTPLGAVLGTSEVNIIEALEVLEQECKNLQADSGEPGQALAVGQVRYHHESDQEHDASRESSHSRARGATFRAGFLSGIRMGYQSLDSSGNRTQMRFRHKEGFSFEFQSANPSILASK